MTAPGPDPPALAQLIADTLANPSTEPAVRAQVLELAARHLRHPEVTASLVSVLPRVREAESRLPLLGLLLSLEPVRIADLPGFHRALVDALGSERERSVRAAILARLTDGLAQDADLTPVLVEALSTPMATDDEFRAVLRSLSSLPALSEDAALALLECSRTAPADLQGLALTAALDRAAWSDALEAALAPYLEPAIDPAVRVRVLGALQQAGRLGPAYRLTLADLLRHHLDPAIRAQALELLGRARPRDATGYQQLVWTAESDPSAELRARAVTLRQDHELSADDAVALAARAFDDPAPAVRQAMVVAVGPFLRDPPVRAALVGAMQEGASRLEDDGALDSAVDSLLAYASREPEVAELLLELTARAGSPGRRAAMTARVLPGLRLDAHVGWVADALGRERQPAVRAVLVDAVRALSVAKYPELAAAFRDELVDPGSSHRTQIAGALAPLVATDPEIRAAFEDCLRHDRDRELQRTCLEAYLDAAPAVSFDVLIDVVADEGFDLRLRGRTLAALEQLAEDPDAGGERRARLDELSAAGRLVGIDGRTT